MNAAARVIKVRPHHAAPMPIILADSFMADSLDYKQAVLVYKTVFVAWHRHTSLTNFILQQSRSFEGVYVPLRLMNCLFPVPASQPTATDHSQSPLYGSGTVFAAYHICSVTSCLLLSLENILLRTLLPVITVVVPTK